MGALTGVIRVLGTCSLGGGPSSDLLVVFSRINPAWQFLTSSPFLFPQTLAILASGALVLDSNRSTRYVVLCALYQPFTSRYHTGEGSHGLHQPGKVLGPNST